MSTVLSVAATRRTESTSFCEIGSAATNAASAAAASCESVRFGTAEESLEVVGCDFFGGRGIRQRYFFLRDLVLAEDFTELFFAVFFAAFLGADRVRDVAARIVLPVAREAIDFAGLR